MPKGSDYKATQVTKMLLVGQSGSGKTGALASLLAAGYNVRVLDFDNGVETLINLLTDAKSPYPKDAISRLDYITLTDEYENVAGKLVCKKASAWPKMASMLENWVDGDQRLGKITTWSSRDILVFDTLTRLSSAALNFYLGLNGWLGKSRSQNEARRDVWAAQQMIEGLLQMIYDKTVQCNIIMNSHIVYVDDEGSGPSLEGERKPQQGFPSSIGKALGPKIPTYFNTVLLAKKDPAGGRWLHTKAGDLVNLKNSAPLRVADRYKIDDGLAKYFEAVRG